MELTPEYKKQQIRNFLSQPSNYERLRNVASFITEGYEYDDLLHSVIEQLLISNQNYPDDIFINNRIYVYIYGALKRHYFSKSNNYKKRHGQKKNMETFIEEDFIEKEENMMQDTILRYTMDDYYEKELIDEKEDQLYEIELCVNYLVASKVINWYEAKLFRMFYFPDKYIDFSLYDLTEDEKEVLINSMSYRKLGKLLDIHFQSIRWAVIKVLEKVKEYIK